MNLPLSSKSSAATLPDSMLHSGMRVTIVGIIINVLLIILKFMGGIIGTSSAMIADAFHSASDLLTDIGVFVGLKFLAKPPDSTHAYGHGRIETAISFLMGLVLALTGLGIFRTNGHAILHFLDGIHPPKPGLTALLAGILSILSKEVLFWYTRRVARQVGSRSLEANAWHHRSDAFSSVGTVLGVGGALLLGERWTVLDPIAAVFVSILIIKIGFDIGWSALKELSDESLSTETKRAVEKAIGEVKGVKDFHYIRTRSLGRYVSLDAHVLVDPELTVREGHEIATEAENAIRSILLNAAFVTIHIEPEDERLIED
ncbi:MAG: cation transporter [Candidatus Latescibacteria bacterium]|nr:cation transporter [Candidatus Latescibacterota bacterium]